MIQKKKNRPVDQPEKTIANERKLRNQIAALQAELQAAEDQLAMFRCHECDAQLKSAPSPEQNTDAIYCPNCEQECVILFDYQEQAYIKNTILLRPAHSGVGGGRGMTEKKNGSAFFTQQVACCMPNTGCLCGPEEKVLRAYIRGEALEPMSEAERNWCCAEADRAGEGAYPKAEAVELDDRELARWVISAWSDYAKGSS